MSVSNKTQPLAGQQRLKILFLTPWYPTQQSPVSGVFIQEHAKAAQLYDDVVVFHCQHRTDLRKVWHVEPKPDDMSSAGLPSYQILHWQPKLPNASFLLELGSVLGGIRRLQRQGFNPDLIHAHTYTSGAVAVLLAKWFHIPAVVTEHSTEFPRKLIRGAGVWKARLAFKYAAAVITVSSALQRAVEAYGIRAQFHIVPNVVDTGIFYPTAHSVGPTKRLLTVALLDLSHKKGIPDLLYALSRLQALRTDWQLDIVGDGPARAEYERLVETLNLTDRIRFHGTMSKLEVARFMQQAHLFVLPSRFETFSVVTAEALAAGLPALVTRCGGPEEFVTAEVGMTVPVGDVEALHTALNTMLDTLNAYVPARTANYAVMHFSPQVVGTTLHNIYLQAGKSLWKTNHQTRMTPNSTGNDAYPNG